MTKRFADKVALITGASARGIGGAIAERLAREGAAGLVLIGREEPTRLLKLLARLDVQTVFQRADVSERSTIDAALESAAATFPKFDIIVNNAGVETAQLMENFDGDVWREMLDINLRGSIEVTQAVLPYLNKPAAIVNVSSALGSGGCSGFNVYSASKAGLDGFTRAMAIELAPEVRVVGVAPALVLTPMTFKHVQKLDQETRDDVEKLHPLGIGMPADVAAVVAFLASEEARWITGVTIPLGFTPAYPLPTDAFM
jgi:3-oxoacyl-[acyl-carrier protein] reductase